MDSRSEGGFARAKALTADRRKEIAAKAAKTRWAPGRKAEYEGPLEIGDVTLDSAVLDDGVRVLTSKAFLIALDRPWKGTYKGSLRPDFVDAKNLDSFVSERLEQLLEPIEYRSLRGQKVTGFRAELLPEVCDLYLRADDENALTPSQKPIARQAYVLMRSLSKVGIVSLVDEATGYQQVRGRSELQKILKAFIAEELLPWAKRFPDSFYEQIHRVWGWPYQAGNNRRNAYIGKLTNRLVYEQLPPGVLEELRQKNPVNPSTKRRSRTHHQHLTEDVGHPVLQNQINAVTTLLRATPDNRKDFFEILFRQAYPGPQGELFEVDPLMAIAVLDEVE